MYECEELIAFPDVAEALITAAAADPPGAALGETGTTAAVGAVVMAGAVGAPGGTSAILDENLPLTLGT